MAPFRCLGCGLVIKNGLDMDEEGYYTCEYCGLKFREIDWEFIQELNSYDGGL